MSKDYGLGTCSCGEIAIVGLNGRGCCVACFEKGLGAIKAVVKPFTMLGQPITDAERQRISRDGP